MLTVSTDTDFSAANTAHADTLTEGQFLVIGHDGNAANTTSTVVDGLDIITRLDRT